MSLPSRLLGANPSIQVSSLLSGTLTTPSAKGAFADGDYESVATSLLSSTATSITFSSIPSTYRYLVVRGSVRSNSAGSSGFDGQIYLNNDTSGSNYARAEADNGNTVRAGSNTAFIRNGIPRASNGSGFGVFESIIYHYADTSKPTIIFSKYAFLDMNVSTRIGWVVCSWNNTAAVTRIDLKPESDSFIANTRISVYGVK